MGNKISDSTGGFIDDIAKYSGHLSDEDKVAFEQASTSMGVKYVIEDGMLAMHTKPVKLNKGVPWEFENSLEPSDTNNEFIFYMSARFTIPQIVRIEIETQKIVNNMNVQMNDSKRALPLGFLGYSYSKRLYSLYIEFLKYTSMIEDFNNEDYRDIDDYQLVRQRYERLHSKLNRLFSGGVQNRHKSVEVSSIYRTIRILPKVFRNSLQRGEGRYSVKNARFYFERIYKSLMFKGFDNYNDLSFQKVEKIMLRHAKQHLPILLNIIESKEGDAGFQKAAKDLLRTALKNQFTNIPNRIRQRALMLSELTNSELDDMSHFESFSGRRAYYKPEDMKYFTQRKKAWNYRKSKNPLNDFSEVNDENENFDFEGLDHLGDPLYDDNVVDPVVSDSDDPEMDELNAMMANMTI